MTATEIKKLIQDTINEFAKDKLDNEVYKLIKDRNTKTRSELVDVIRDAMVTVHKYMWVQKDTWKNNIK